MKKLFSWLLLASLLGSCATERYAPATDPKVDSVLVAAGVPPLSLRKLKITGNLIVNTGAGSVSTADNRKAGQRQGSAATAPHAQASNASKKGGAPWYVLAGLAALAGASGFYLRGRVKIPLPF